MKYCKDCKHRSWVSTTCLHGMRTIDDPVTGPQNDHASVTRCEGERAARGWLETRARFEKRCGPDGKFFERGEQQKPITPLASGGYIHVAGKPALNCGTISRHGPVTDGPMVIKEVPTVNIDINASDADLESIKRLHDEISAVIKKRGGTQ